MPRIDWHKRRHSDELEAARNLRMTIEQRGALVTVIDLIYHHANDLADDARYIAGQLGVDLRVWKRLRAELITLGKIHIEDGRICNGEAGRGVLAALDAIAASAHAGRSKGAKYREQSGQINQLALSLDAIPMQQNKNKKESISSSESGSARGPLRVAAPEPRAKPAYNSTQAALMEASGLTRK